MVSRLLLVYAVVELAAVFALVWALGWGWTLLILLATFVLGWGLLAPMAGSQLLHQLRGMRSGSLEARSVGDGALVTVATGLVLVPGLVTTVIGTLLLLPPVRAAAGPGVSALALRTLQRRVPLVTYPAAFTQTQRGDPADRRDYIDGEVIDVHDVEPPALRSDDHWGGPRYASGPS
ncbi:FxsA family protein [Mycobacterium rhizamassiliense]|nr:FxsA family protein [Mycobacterium rhizamassiliense]